MKGWGLQLGMPFLIVYIILYLVLFSTDITLFYFNPTAISVSKIIAESLIGISFLSAITLKRIAWLIGVIPPLLILILLSINSEAGIPNILVIILLPFLLILYLISKRRPLSLLIKCIILVSFIVSLLLIGYSYYLTNRTGIANPYTKQCISEGYRGAKGDSCY